METPESTDIRAIRYDAERRRLVVRFIDGTRRVLNTIYSEPKN